MDEIGERVRKRSVVRVQVGIDLFVVEAEIEGVVLKSDWGRIGSCCRRPSRYIGGLRA
jgi:hypothetical protein